MSLINIEAAWQYQTEDNEVPVSPESVSVPTTGWTAGLSPFGEGVPPITLTLPNTVWTKATGLWIRRFLNTDGEKDIIVKGNCEQALFLYWDGEFVGSLNPTNTDRADTPEYRIVVDRTLATAGSHEIALLCLDDEGDLEEDLSYISVVADYSPVVFPFQPQAPVSEKLSFATDVMMSRNGTEERNKLAKSPRQEFKYMYPTGYERTPKAQNILWGDLKNEMLVPIWTQAVRMVSVTANLTTISLDTRYSEFRAPGFAIIWSSPEKYQLVGIYEMTDSSITISNPTESFAGCWIMPVRTGVPTKGVSKNSNGYNSFFEVEFLIRDNDQVLGDDPEQYLSEDIYLEPTLLSGDYISQEFDISLEVFDPGLGQFSFVTGLERARGMREFRVFCKDISSSWAFREFLNRRSGRYKQFYQPSFENDLRITNTDLITDILEVRKDEYMRSSQSRTKIAIETQEGWLIREIIDVASIDENRMSIQVGSDLNIYARDIIRTSWLGLKRLDTDTIDINHIGAGVSQSSFMVVEIG